MEQINFNEGSSSLARAYTHSCSSTTHHTYSTHQAQHITFLAYTLTPYNRTWYWYIHTYSPPILNSLCIYICGFCGHINAYTTTSCWWCCCSCRHIYVTGGTQQPFNKMHIPCDRFVTCICRLHVSEGSNTFAPHELYLMVMGPQEHINQKAAQCNRVFWYMFGVLVATWSVMCGGGDKVITVVISTERICQGRICMETHIFNFLSRFHARKITKRFNTRRLSSNDIVRQRKCQARLYWRSLPVVLRGINFLTSMSPCQLRAHNLFLSFAFLFSSPPFYISQRTCTARHFSLTSASDAQR